jgi:trimeric autotransporter adhesin
MERLPYLLTVVLTILILMFFNSISQAQTSFNVANKTTGDTLLTIDNDGNVGVGTTFPQNTVDIQSSGIDSGPSIGLSNLDRSHWLSLWSGQGGATPYGPAFTWQDGDPLRFVKYGTVYTELMRLTSEGNLGIGTTNPSAKFTISGISGSLNHGESAVFLQNSNRYFDFNGGMIFRGSGMNWNSRFTATDNLGADEEVVGIYKHEATAGDVLNDVTGVIAIFKNNGNVGIGLTDPDQGLVVADTIRSTVGGFQFPDGSVQETAAGAGLGNTLDQAYDQDGAGAGNTITADAGAVTVAGTDGFLSTGTFGSGATPPAGGGTRMLWYPGKAAFRAGYVNSSQWSDAQIGNYSIGMGNGTIASGQYSTAIGVNNTASGTAAIALGANTRALGLASTAMGNDTEASAAYSTAFGLSTTASGLYSMAMGQEIEAQGSHTVAIALSDQNGLQVTQDTTMAIMGGKVGIGTIAPTTRLEVADTIYSSIGGFKFPDGTVQETAAAGGGGASSIDDLSDGKTGGNSVFLGANAGISDDGSNNQNVAAGINALNANTTGSSNIAQGYNSLISNISGNSNIAIGSHALSGNTTGGFNVGIGSNANNHNLTGSQNTIIGALAGGYGVDHSKSRNIFIGYMAGLNETGNDKLYIENSSSTTPLIGGDFATDEINLHGEVYVRDRLGIGTTSPAAGMHLHGTGFPSSFMYLSSETGGSAGFRLYEGSTAKWHIFNSYTLDGLQIYNDNGQTAFFADQSTGNVGIGTTTPLSHNKLHVIGDLTGVRGQVYNDNGISGITGVAGHANGSAGENRGISGFAYEGNRNCGVYGAINISLGGSFNAAIFGQAGPLVDYAGYFVGNLNATGTNTKGASITKIDHPLDPENKYLYHSSVESSDMMNVYNGNVILDSNGEAWVNLPDWFEALNKEFRYQLTCIGGFAQIYISEEVKNNRFQIAGGKLDMKVSWQITGIRKDKLAEQHRIVVEKEKPAGERGYYLHPSLYGLSKSMGIDFQKNNKYENK